VNGTKQAPGPSDALRERLYGQASLDERAKEGGGNPHEPWRSFERARRLIRRDDSGQAVKVWYKIAIARSLTRTQYDELAGHTLAETRLPGLQPAADALRQLWRDFTDAEAARNRAP